MVSSHQIDAFPYTSARGNMYVMVMEDSVADPILAIGIKSRKEKRLIEGFITMYNTLKKTGMNPVLHRIDNEFLSDLIDEIEARVLKYKIAPPGNHTLSLRRG